MLRSPLLTVLTYYLSGVALLLLLQHTHHTLTSAILPENTHDKMYAVENIFVTGHPTFKQVIRDPYIRFSYNLFVAVLGDMNSVRRVDRRLDC
jgi:hypothetical protein